jgi:hypothetical protein
MLSMLLFSLLGIGATLAAGSIFGTTLVYGSDWEALAREMRGRNIMPDARVGSHPVPAHRETLGSFGGTGNGLRVALVAVRPRHEQRAVA